jgi:molybdopterin-guanine dinucleotide biosynthesis protein A
MGRNKGLIPVLGKPLVARVADALLGRFDETFIVAGDVAAYGFLGLPLVPDRTPGIGPLMGIASALGAARRDVVFVIACDVPDVDFLLVERLLAAAAEHDIAVPRVGPNLYEPLFAVYRASALPAIELALARGARRVQAVFPSVRTTVVDVDGPTGIRNLNTPRDVERYLEDLRSGAGR